MKPTAADDMIKIVSAIMAELGELQEKAENHFDVNPDRCDWGHVGSAAQVLSLLQQANGKGE